MESDLMRAEIDRRPQKVQRHLCPPELHRPSGVLALPYTPAGDGDEHIEHRPHRPKQPGGRIEERFGQACIPRARRGKAAEGEGAAQHKNEEKDR